MTFEEPPVEASKAHTLWTSIGEAVHARIGPKITAARTEATAGMLEQIEQDLVPLVRPLARQLLDAETTPAELRPALEVLAGPEHFSGSIVISFAVGALLSPVLGSALAPLVQTISNNAWATTPSNPLTPAVLAEMALKGVSLTGSTQIGSGELAAEALNSGIDPARFAAMTQAAGQSLGFAEALLLQRRSQLVGVTLTDVLGYSNINPKFYDSAMNLIYDSPPTGEIIAARVKNRLNDIDARRKYTEAGGNPVDFDWAVSTGGRPLGLEEMAHLVNYGHATDADLAQAAAQSDLAVEFQKFVPFLKEYHPPVRSIIPMLRAGAANEAQCRKYWNDEGVPVVLQDIYVKEAAHTSTGAAKALGQAQIVAMYEARLLPAPTALARLVALTYPAADAQALLDLADEKRSVSLQNAALRKIGAEYVGYKITLAEAQTAMATAAVPTAAQQDQVKYWDVEKSVNIHKPTAPMIMGAFRRGDIDGAEAHARLLAAGVILSDMHIFAADGFPPTKPNPKGVAIVVAGSALYVDGTSQPPATGTKAETITQITGLYVGRIIDKPTAVAKLEALGYTAADAADLIALAGPQSPLPTPGA